ncbi:MAG: flagellar export chaperone FliS [Acidobacteriaceae bacterium]
MDYQQQALAVMNPVELVVALYDGMIRFLYRATASVEAGDVAGRRESIRYVLEILTYLQARLRPDIGGQPAVALAEFYAAMYAQCVRASRDASIPLLEKSIRDIMNVREAWNQVSLNDPHEDAKPRKHGRIESTSSTFQPAGPSEADASILASPWMETESRRWSA